MTLAVIPTYCTNNADIEVLRTTVSTLQATAPNCNILLVDDCSPHERIRKKIRKFEQKGCEVWIKEENSGFSKTVNVGLRIAEKTGQDAVLVNADVELTNEGWLDKMLATQGNQVPGPASVVGAMLTYPSGVVQHAGVYFSLLTRSFHHIGVGADPGTPELLRRRSCPVTGALMLVRNEALTSVGLFDEDFSMGFEDVDYCLRTMESGRECVINPDVRAIHHESLFRGRGTPKLNKWHAESAQHLAEKWKGKSFAHLCPPL